jgi:hypothetical protein
MASISYYIVMPGLVPGIHVWLWAKKVVDGHDKHGHDVDLKTLARRWRRRAGVD